MKSAGFTFIEVILVVAIMEILGATSAPFLTNFIFRNNLETTVDKTISVIRKAQEYAMDGKNDTVWGVCYTDGAIRFFSGNCATPTIKEDFTVPASVTITGFTATTFSAMRGEPNAAMSITVNGGISSKTVTVNIAGGMSVN